jgi:DNA-binding MarR family transcriptional regulator
MTTVYDEALASVGVNLAQFSLLKNIRRHAPVSLTELAGATELDRSTIGRNVKVLERMGLARTVASTDQREASIELTEAGQGTLQTAMPLWEQVQHDINARLGAANVAQLEHLLASL